MLILANGSLIGLLSPLQVVAAVESAARSWELGNAIVPQRVHTEWDGKTLLTMPAVADGDVGIKLVLVVPSNAGRGLPITNGLMILNDGETGQPVAVMNAAALTAQRTGAVGALGVKYMTPATTSSVGIVGCGVQGAWQAVFACAVRPISDVFCVYRSPASFEKFTATLCRQVPEVRITSCRDARELLARTSVVITATTSKEPVLPDDPSLLEGKHFISVGSYKPTMQELPDSVYRLAGQLAIDSEFARQEVGDVIQPVEKGILKQTDIFLISELVTGQRSVNTSRTTAYKSTGMALYDLFVAEALYQVAKRQNIGCEINL